MADIKIKTDIPIYFGYVVIVFSEDVKAVSDKYKLGLSEQGYPAFVKGNRNSNGITQYWLVFDRKKISHSIIAHEVTHCANWIFYDRDITVDFRNDEPYAYLVGWITGVVYRAIKKHRIEV